MDGTRASSPGYNIMGFQPYAGGKSLLGKPALEPCAATGGKHRDQKTGKGSRGRRSAPSPTGLRLFSGQWRDAPKAGGAG